MKKNNDYQYIQPQVDNRRKKNSKKKKKAKKKGGFIKGLLIFIAILVLLAAGLFLYMRYTMVDLYSDDAFQNIPAVQYIDEKLLGHTTTQLVEITETTTEKVTLAEVSYLEHSDFKFDANKKGAMIGNILNGGKVDKDNGVVYHIVDGRGIYKFNPGDESFSCIYKTENTLSSLNIRGDYLYFVDESDNHLYKRAKSGKDNKSIAEDIKQAYIYDSTAYCITSLNHLVAVDTQNGARTLLYGADAVDKVELIGISLDRVFFTVTDSLDVVAYFAVSTSGGNAEKFRFDTKDGEILSMSMENGFIYYYQKQTGGSYNLIRQKYGSEKTVELATDVAVASAIVESNKVFFTRLNGSNLDMIELNMNTNNEKIMISCKDISDNDSVFIQHGGEYDFIIGTRQNGDKVYRGSSNLTGSNNVMTFKGGSWSY